MNKINNKGLLGKKLVYVHISDMFRPGAKLDPEKQGHLCWRHKKMSENIPVVSMISLLMGPTVDQALGPEMARAGP